MDAQGLEGLPKSLQLVISSGFFVGAIVVAVLGYLKPKFGNRSREHGATGREDAVVISAAFADRKSIADLERSIKDLSGQVERMCESINDQERAEERTADAISRNTDAVIRMQDAFRDAVAALSRARTP